MARAYRRQMAFRVADPAEVRAARSPLPGLAAALLGLALAVGMPALGALIAFLQEVL